MWGFESRCNTTTEENLAAFNAVFNSVFSPGFVRESPVSVGLDRDAPYHRDGGMAVAVVLVASCKLARRDPSHSNKTLTKVL